MTDSPGAMPQEPLVSVVMPFYNSGEYLAPAISSILNQSYSRLELIAVDDGSTDGSVDVVRAFAAADSRVRIVATNRAGTAHARNAGISVARGELIGLLDHDDVAMQDRFAAQVAWMRNTGVAVCGGCAMTIGASNHLFWFPEQHEAICNEMFFRCPILAPTALMRTEVVREHPFADAASSEDYDLWARLAPHYRLGNMPQVVINYRIHTRQRSTLERQQIRADMRRIRDGFFQRTFPEASVEDHIALVHVDEGEPAVNLAELARAGSWLVRLATPSDNYQRKMMARRWSSACRNSAGLGPGVYRLYRSIAPRFGVASGARASSLRLACLLRLKPNSVLTTRLGWFRGKLNRPASLVA